MNFPFETNGKLMILGVPILRHFRVFICILYKGSAHTEDAVFDVLKNLEHPGPFMANILSVQGCRILSTFFFFSTAQ